MKYVTTKKRCESQIGDVVCPGCGGKVVPIRTVDNAGNPTYWSGCNYCQKFTPGCKKEIRKIAKELVIRNRYVPFKSNGLKKARNRNARYNT